MSAAPNDDWAALVERLRKRGKWVTTKFVPLFPQMNEEEWVPDSLCQEAADAIEALAATPSNVSQVLSS